MRKIFLTYCLLVITCCTFAQERREQNRPYTDLRPVHFGIVAGMNFQDTKFSNVGLQQLTTVDGVELPESEIYCDQNNWSMGFNVGVLMETRLNQCFAFRAAPQLYFNSRSLQFYNQINKQVNADPIRQDLKMVYVGADLDLIFASQRFNNHRPYVMAGLAPMVNLTSNSGEYVRLKPFELFLEVGMGCDFYLPFFKLRPEIKFMYGLTNSLDNNYIKSIRDDSILPYSASVNKARSKMFVISFYFE